LGVLGGVLTPSAFDRAVKSKRLSAKANLWRILTSRVGASVVELSLPGGAASEIPRSMAEDTSKTAPIRRVVLGSRFLAATVVVPPEVAEPVLAVIRDEGRATGRCTLSVARIAERANVGRAKARAAIRLAERLGIIAIEVAPDRKRMIINRCVTSRC
jgi:hypothetical protein